MLLFFRRPSSVVSTLTLSALGLGVTPLACGDSPKLDDGTTTCETPGDCPEGQVCTYGGICKTACSKHDDCSSGQFCASWGACESQCVSCGSSCSVTDDCPNGQHCSGGQCHQECTPGTEGGVCGEFICSVNGKCSGRDDIDFPLGGAGGMSGGDGDNVDCIDLDVTFEPQIPNVVLLIDQSGSMTAADGFGSAVQAAIDAGTYQHWDCPNNEQNWRWNVVRNVLFHPENGVVKPLEDKVRFGMALYSSDNGTLRDSECPLLTEVEIGFGAHEAMLDQFQCSEILEDTPTRESLTAVAEKLAAMDLEGPKIIVLATDGEPDNCYCPDWGAQGNASNNPPLECYDNNPDNAVTRGGVEMIPSNAEQYDVVMEAQRIYEELGIRIEVINVSTPNNATLAAHLDDVAERGGAASGASIDGFDPGSLIDAFTSIIDGVRSCAIDLDGSIGAGKESTGTITLNGEPLLLNDPDGWVVNSPTQIELQGEACDMIKSGDHDLQIKFPCGSFVPMIR
jgi:hypothetical protein